MRKYLNESYVKTGMFMIIAILVTIFTKNNPLFNYYQIICYLLLLFIILNYFYVRFINNTKEKSNRLINKKQAMQKFDKNIYTAFQYLSMTISGEISKYYPDAKWSWVTDNPQEFALKGGIARIRLSGADEITFCELNLDVTSYNLKIYEITVNELGSRNSRTTDSNCDESLVPVSDWYNSDSGMAHIDKIASELLIQSHEHLYIDKHGTVFVMMNSEFEDTGHELKDFPPKKQWENIIELLKEDSISAEILEDKLKIAIK